MVALGMRVYGTAPDIGGSERVQMIDNFPVLPITIAQSPRTALSTSSAAYVQPTGGPSVGDGLLLESGTYFLILETGDYLLLE